MAEKRGLLCFILVFHFLYGCVSSNGAVVITKANRSLVFESADASFAPKAPTAGICGTIVVGDPINACESIVNASSASEELTCSQFALVSRGGCSFDTKVRHVQDAGFRAALIADNVDNTELITMAGNKKDIYIPAVFISKAAGDVLLQYVNDSYAECWILPSYESIAWLLMLVSFISLIVITGIFALCFLIRQQRSNQRSRRSKEPSIISYEIVKSLPSVIYCSTNNANQSYDTCAICLEDYVDGTVLRILPCNHGFHGSCIDSWLMNWRGFCPICKQDVVKAISSTENAPLLLPNDSQQSTAQVCLPLTQETCEEACGIPINIAASDPDSEPCQFHFSQPLLRLSSSPARAPRRTRHLSWISLTDPNSVEAFRASPYFTPPSFFRSSAPNVLCHQVP